MNKVKKERTIPKSHEPIKGYKPKTISIRIQVRTESQERKFLYEKNDKKINSIIKERKKQ